MTFLGFYLEDLGLIVSDKQWCEGFSLAFGVRIPKTVRE